MKVLYVCTANICRSASAAQLLGEYLQQRGVAGVEIRSAGTQALAGMPGCSVAPALQGVDHTSQPLTAEMLAWADLVLPAARDHLATIAGLNPRARQRVFTIRQAGRLAGWAVANGIVPAALARAGTTDADWSQQYPADDPRHFVAALPADQEGRGAWVAEELDAARGLVPLPAEPAPVKTSRWRRKATEEVQTHPDDIPDPHELGEQWHEPAYRYLQEGTAQLADLLAEVLPRGDR